MIEIAACSGLGWEFPEETTEIFWCVGCPACYQDDIAEIGGES